MAKLIINGRFRLGGTLTPVGNKNGALPMLAACLLTDEPVVLHNVPKIEDVAVMLELLASLGVEISREERTVRLQARKIHRRDLDRTLCRRVRASILIAGPLVARHGRAVVPPPGGDVIGRRRLDTHFDGLRALGIQVQGGTHYTFRRRELKGADLLLDEASVTATENILMAATLAEGETTIFNAACEPHVTDLCRLLVAMGAQIEGIGTNFVRIRGVKTLRGAEHTVEPDYIEIGSYLAAAAVTHGELTVKGAATLPAMRVVSRHFAKLGLKLNKSGDDLVLPAHRSLSVVRDVGRALPKIEDGIWPAFPSDLMSVAIVLATQARGSVLFFEKMFESRMYFVDRLIEMGANIVQCDPHRVVVQGPGRLHGTHLSSPDIRAGMAMLIAALCAKGQSVIDQAQVIDRGYERIDDRLRELGAHIERVD
jgi:UDP-N-acetylglucosamine 1-carboxyvinyltransferase